MPGRGGKRPGAGRKPLAFKRAANATPIQAAEARIRDRLPALVDKLFELAEGVEVQEIDRNGERKVYSQPPDYRSISYLMDRVMGKPVARQEGGAPGDFGLNLEDVTSDTIRAALRRVK